MQQQLSEKTTLTGFEKLNFKKIGEELRESPYTFYDGILVFSKYELNKEDYRNGNCRI